MKACKKCGAEIPEGMKFCGNCGAPVEAEVEEDLQEKTKLPASKEIVKEVEDQTNDLENGEATEEKEQPERAAGGKRKKILLMVVIAVVLVIGIAAI